mmetsp:Transcript_32174/g.49868  ORF Transcript_32174/g.49868 Transcript_32174/m.49868 type:complete len:205 (+) Transcript_32174:651-1265(+)
MVHIWANRGTLKLHGAILLNSNSFRHPCNLSDSSRLLPIRRFESSVRKVDMFRTERNFASKICPAGSTTYAQDGFPFEIFGVVVADRVHCLPFEIFLQARYVWVCRFRVVSIANEDCIKYIGLWRATTFPLKFYLGPAFTGRRNSRGLVGEQCQLLDGGAVRNIFPQIKMLFVRLKIVQDILVGNETLRNFSPRFFSKLHHFLG